MLIFSSLVFNSVGSTFAIIKLAIESCTHLSHLHLLFLFIDSPTMKYSLILLAAPLVANGAIFQRDAQSILSALSTIGSNLQKLSSSISEFQGQISQSVPIVTAESDLDSSLKSGVSAAQGSSTLSDSDTDSVLSAVNSLIPEIMTAVNLFVSKQPLFSSAGIGGVASTDIVALSSDTNALASALVAIAPTSAMASAASATSCINAAFASAKAGSTASSCGPAATGSGSSQSGASTPAATTSGGSSSNSAVSSAAAFPTSTSKSGSSNSFSR
jgi:hypothetical protein